MSRLSLPLHELDGCYEGGQAIGFYWDAGFLRRSAWVHKYMWPLWGFDLSLRLLLGKGKDWWFQLGDGYIVFGSVPLLKLVTARDCADLFSSLYIPAICTDICTSHLSFVGLWLPLSIFSNVAFASMAFGDAPSAPAKTQHLELVSSPRSVISDFWTCFILPSWVLTSYWKELGNCCTAPLWFFYSSHWKKKQTNNPTPKPPSRTQSLHPQSSSPPGIRL